MDNANNSGQLGFRWPAEAIVPSPETRTSGDGLYLNRRYTFENFVVGPSNRLAHAATLSASQSPGSAYNPLFLHGLSGLGKTHLMQAVCHAALKKGSGIKIIYLSCESFVNNFIAAVQHGSLEDFRARYRNADMLLIDDVHFLAHKEGSQEEFFHTFNTLYNTERQIVLSSDSPPREIPTLEERLVSRFKWGLVARIEPPSFETRVAILKKKADQMDCVLPNDVAHYLAENINTNVRELEGAVTKISGMSSLEKKPVTIETAREAISDSTRADTRKFRIEEIRDAVAAHYRVKPSEMQSRGRSKSIVLPRQLCMYLLRKLTDYSLEEIGGFMGGRDHSTVLYAGEKIAAESKKSDELKHSIDTIIRKLKRG